jgi:hypothetical protein
MLDVGIPVWAHVALLIGAFALLGFFERAAWQRESALRRKLGACRTSLASAEILRDQYRRVMQAQSVELARYRGQIPPELRVTQVLLDDEGKVTG